MVDIGIYIGRFQPFHNGHLRVVRQALSFSDFLVVLIGSAQEQGTVKNPWSWGDRASMILSSLRPTERRRVIVQPVLDMPGQNGAWVNQVKALVERRTRPVLGPYLNRKKDSRCYTLIGCNKDDSSFYLKLFPEWKLRLIPQWRALNATDVRKSYFEESNENWMAAVPGGTCGYLEAFNRHNFSAFTRIASELEKS